MGRRTESSSTARSRLTKSTGRRWMSRRTSSRTKECPTAEGAVLCKEVSSSTEVTATSSTEATVTTTTRDTVTIRATDTATSKVTVTRVDTEVTSNKEASRGEDSVEARGAVEDSEKPKEAGVTTRTATSHTRLFFN